MKTILAPLAAALACLLAPAHAQPPGAESSAAAIPQPPTSVTVDTQVAETPTAIIETKREVIAPVATRPAVDPQNPIAPEVKALVAAKKNYTTADIVRAQHEAMIATPASAPTTVITTTTTTPKPG